MRLLPILFIVCAVLISVGAISSLTEQFGVGVDQWYGPLAAMQMVYTDLMDKAFGSLSRMLDNRWGLTIPAWAPEFMVLYLGAGLAFVSGTAGIGHREKITETLKATALGTIMPLAIPLFVWHVFRLGLVSRFARDNSLSFFAYVALVAGAYFGSVIANNQIYKPRALEETVAAEAALSRDEIEAMGAMDRSTKVANTVTVTMDGGEAVAVPAAYTPETARAMGEQLGRSLQQHAAGGTASPVGDLQFVPGADPDGLFPLDAFEREVRGEDAAEN